jgi:hypothetical protein
MDKDTKDILEAVNFITDHMVPRGAPGPGSPIKKGWAGGPGRPKGSPNRIKADLAQLIMDAAGVAGFLKKNKRGKQIPTGLDGCKGYLLWLAGVRHG